MTKKLTFCTMMSVFGILCILISNFLQFNTVFLYLFSTLFTYICTEEYGIKYGILVYAVISTIGFFISTDKLTVIAYIVIVGYYPVIKHIIEHINSNILIKRILKILFATLVSTIFLYVINKFYPMELNVGLLYILGIILFIIYDIALTIGIKFYALRIRKFK